ncbi:MAG: cytochrome b/b6 domain-containing protein [Gammaproteobacteria bacterium]|nr:cytochrome b/b6 domain-containing protein [Gammaproteobacteria bacterium]
MQAFRYRTPQIVIHWLVAALTIFLVATGTFILAEMPNTAEKIMNLRIHLIVGALTALLVVVRIILRKRMPAPPTEKLVMLGHMALNLVLLLMAMSGMVLALQSDLFAALFAGAALPEDFEVFTPRQIHGLGASLVMVLVAIHVAAALYHQLIVKDGLMARMGLGGK